MGTLLVPIRHSDLDKSVSLLLRNSGGGEQKGGAEERLDVPGAVERYHVNSAPTRALVPAFSNICYRFL